MANQDPPLFYLQPNSLIRDHLPFQSRFGPWFYKADEYGADDYQFWGVTGLFITVAVAAVLLNVSQISELYSRRGYRMKYMLRALLHQSALLAFVFLGWAIVGSTFSYKWSEAEIVDNFRYRAGSAEHVHARLGIHMGLTGFNVTLVGLPEEQNGQLIYWNERYSWQDSQGETGGWNHGRFGFGPYSNLMSQQFRAGQYRGTPYPVLEVLEWFSLDGEDLRWNRWYLNGSYYCYVFLWLAFPFYLITAITCSLQPATGALWLALTGLTMWFAATLYSGLIQKTVPLSIPFGEHHLEPKTSTTYWLVLIVGIITNVIGAILAYGFHAWDMGTFMGYIQNPSQYRNRHTAVLQAVSANQTPQENAKPSPSVHVRSGRSSIRTVAGSGTTMRRSSTDLSEQMGSRTKMTSDIIQVAPQSKSIRGRADQLRSRRSRRNRTKFGQELSQEAFVQMQPIGEFSDEEYEPSSPNPLSHAGSRSDLLADLASTEKATAQRQTANARVIQFDSIPGNTGIPMASLNGDHQSEAIDVDDFSDDEGPVTTYMA
jgi:hypothetical protein